ncbi:acyl carrier protein [Halodesulfovibrio aestuarii]|uniref:Acyl carrier protein n=1 Tax=Halodesulfovibrio aestuarii TaxID=126333 RepID=A0A8G2C7T7_9BACT|nr:acyl carrier protein [Halodesulfovibrio aestuarii]SHI70445.1 acyl carrier protein [Halodesulfovibrio aestuarii]
MTLATMTKEEIIEITNNAISDEFEFDLEQMVPTAHLYKDLGLDSLDAVDLVLLLEKSFGVKLRNQPEVKEVRTLEDIYKLIMQLQQDAA